MLYIQNNQKKIKSIPNPFQKLLLDPKFFTNIYSTIQKNIQSLEFSPQKSPLILKSAFKPALVATIPRMNTFLCIFTLLILNIDQYIFVVMNNSY